MTEFSGSGLRRINRRSRFWRATMTRRCGYRSGSHQVEARRSSDHQQRRRHHPIHDLARVLPVPSLDKRIATFF